MSTPEPEHTFNFCGNLLILEEHGPYLQIVRPDGTVMIRFENFDGVAFLDGPKQEAYRASRLEWERKHSGNSGQG